MLTPLMARNALKSNVTWASYPFVPPTGASGFFADLLNGMKWHETNDNCVRHLDSLPDYPGTFALGAYPTAGHFSRRHFRAHLGSLSFNYEGRVWAAGKNEGKKLAVIEEFLTDELRFVVVAREPGPLQRLHDSARGRIAPIAKKGSIQLEFAAEPVLTRLARKAATGAERTISVVPFVEVGSLPDGLLPYLVPLRSEGTKRGVQWHTQHCAWNSDLLFREGTPIYASDSVGVSHAILDMMGVFS